MDKRDSISQTLAFRAMILFQILAYGSYSVLVHLCEQNGNIMFSSTAMNLILELLKLIFSLATYTLQTDKRPSITLSASRSWLQHSLPYSIPGLLYFVNNNLAVHMQLQMDPASYQILSNFKIVTTALLYRLIIKQKLSRQQWCAIGLLFFGGLFYSLGELSSVSSLTLSLMPFLSDSHRKHQPYDTASAVCSSCDTDVHSSSRSSHGAHLLHSQWSGRGVQ